MRPRQGLGSLSYVGVVCRRCIRLAPSYTWQVIELGVNLRHLYVDTVGDPELYQRKLEGIFPSLARAYLSILSFTASIYSIYMYLYLYRYLSISTSGSFRASPLAGARISIYLFIFYIYRF